MFSATVVQYGVPGVPKNQAEKIANFITTSPIIAPLLRLLFSRKGIAGLALIIFEVIIAYTGNMEMALAVQHAVLIVLAYIVSTAWEDVARTSAQKGRV